MHQIFNICWQMLSCWLMLLMLYLALLDICVFDSHLYYLLLEPFSLENKFSFLFLMLSVLEINNVICSSWAGFKQRYTNRSQIILLTAWGHLEPGCVSVPLEIRSIFSESLPLKLKLYLVLLLLSLCTINLLCSIFICVSFYICM